MFAVEILYSERAIVTAVTTTMEEEEVVSDIINNNNKKCNVQEIEGVTLGESNTDSMGSCDSLLEIVNYLDSADYNFEKVTDDDSKLKLNGVVESESEDCGVTVVDVSDRNVEMPDISVIANEKISNGIKRSSSVRSDASDHIISQFLDRSVDDVG